MCVGSYEINALLKEKPNKADKKAPKWVSVIDRATTTMYAYKGNQWVSARANQQHFGTS